MGQSDPRAVAREEVRGRTVPHHGERCEQHSGQERHEQRRHDQCGRDLQVRNRQVAHGSEADARNDGRSPDERDRGPQRERFGHRFARGDQSQGEYQAGSGSIGQSPGRQHRGRIGGAVESRQRLRDHHPRDCNAGTKYNRRDAVDGRRAERSGIHLQFPDSEDEAADAKECAEAAH